MVVTEQAIRNLTISRAISVQLRFARYCIEQEKRCIGSITLNCLLFKCKRRHSYNLYRYDICIGKAILPLAGAAARSLSCDVIAILLCQLHNEAIIDFCELQLGTICDVYRYNIYIYICYLCVYYILYIFVCYLRIQKNRW